ncbi:Rv3235 family protein [Leifsonia sp. 2MCAF36]|uniref:Rv3235 family protein n=1 Tax=Leifsonia sp. 2MCAF36 TaxID=3232988 RepID=UPI003F9B9B54
MHHSALAPTMPTASRSVVLRRPRPWPTDVTVDPAPTDRDADDVAPIAESGNPDPATLCSNLARCVIEILAGARPLDQIGRWVSDSVYVHLLRRTMLAVRTRAVSTEDPLRPRMTIGDPRLAFPSEGVVEAVVLVHQPARSRAVAIRLERHRARWRATAINVL